LVGQNTISVGKYFSFYDMFKTKFFWAEKMWVVTATEWPELLYTVLALKMQGSGTLLHVAGTVCFHETFWCIFKVILRMNEINV